VGATTSQGMAALPAGSDDGAMTTTTAIPATTARPATTAAARLRTVLLANAATSTLAGVVGVAGVAVLDLALLQLHLRRKLA